MNRIKLIKKFLMPCGLCAAVPLMKSDEEKSKSVQDVNHNKNVKQFSDLGPYYRPPIQRVAAENVEPSQLERKIAIIRRSIQEKFKTFTAYKEIVKNTFTTGYAHSKDTLDYLREESSTLPRIGAVGIGGLTGLILGSRGGKLKKLMYSSTGVLILGSICYPKQAEEGLKLAKYYLVVGYNFFCGVKPEEKNESEESVPAVQSTFSKMTNLINDSSVGTIFSKIKQTYNDFAATPEPPGEKKKKES